MIVSGTGHRPDKLGGWPFYESGGYDLMCDYAASLLMEINPSLVISGVALGWDSALADAALFLKLPLVAAVPFKGQEARWSPKHKTRYWAFLERAQSVEVICEGGYAPWKLQKRNEWMVDRADLVLALFDGTSGGTANCVAYAERKGKEIRNVWKGWKEIADARPVQEQRTVHRDTVDRLEPLWNGPVVRGRRKGK